VWSTSSKLRKIEKIEKTLNKMAINSERGIPILVEGKKDKRSLRRLSIKGEIICIKSNRWNLQDLLSTMKSYDEIIVLTDFDREGEELAKSLENELNFEKIKPNLSFWKDLKRLAGHDLNAIEGLSTYFNRIKLKLKN
jgi:2,5-diamino-6-(ribosylamino)-4(3H)-pyrimidinone 5'-phosphate reductase